MPRSIPFHPNMNVALHKPKLTEIHAHNVILVYNAFSLTFSLTASLNVLGF